MHSNGRAGYSTFVKALGPYAPNAQPYTRYRARLLANPLHHGRARSAPPASGALALNFLRQHRSSSQLNSIHQLSAQFSAQRSSVQSSCLSSQHLHVCARACLRVCASARARLDYPPLSHQAKPSLSSRCIRVPVHLYASSCWCVAVQRPLSVLRSTSRAPCYLPVSAPCYLPVSHADDILRYQTLAQQPLHRPSS